jgi:GT2 family glycosyltransferase
MSKRNHNRQPNKLSPRTSKTVIDTRTKLDIIICVYNRFDLLGKCLKSIPEAAGEVSYNVVLIDNASTEKEEADNFYRSISDNRQNMIIIRNKENAGFPAGCNQGAKRKQSPFIFFLNSDVILYPDAISNLIKTFDNPKVGVAGMKLLFPPDDCAGLNTNIRPAGKIQHIGMETNIRGDFVHVFLGWDADHPKANKFREPYAVTGAALMTKRSIWNRVGGFREEYGRGTFEDVDYCLSVRALDFTVVVDPSAVGIHYTGATAEKYQMGYPMDLNRLTFLQRWAGRINYTEYLVY